MIVPIFTAEQFVQYLKLQGCDTIENEALRMLNRVGIVLPTGKVINMQTDRQFAFNAVVRFCDKYDLCPPEDHLEFYNGNGKKETIKVSMTSREDEEE